jgi:glycosyltransferase involved in cell wall biosynthesis
MSDLPLISIVTPNLNGNTFLASCLKSVINQDYPTIEYIVVDGLSNDGSVQTIEKYQQHLAHILNETDHGHYDAVSKGFSLATGEIMGWLNSDDWLLPGSLRIVGEIFNKYPEIRWLSTSYPLTINKDGSIVRQRFIGGFNSQTFFQGANLPFGSHYQRGNIQQESTFWRRSLWDDAGGYLSNKCSLAGDFELWSRFFHLAELYAVRAPLAAFRLHGNQRSLQFSSDYHEQALAILYDTGGGFTPVRSSILRVVNSIVAGGPVNGRLPKTLIRLIRGLGLFTMAPVVACHPFDGWQKEIEFIL